MNNETEKTINDAREIGYLLKSADKKELIFMKDGDEFKLSAVQDSNAPSFVKINNEEQNFIINT